MIIIEGTDCAGKTTLAREICRQAQYPMMYRHFGLLPKMFDYYGGYVSCVDMNAVLDRFHMSELVYSVSLDRKSGLTPLKYEMVDAAISAIGGMVVVLNPSFETLKARYAATKDTQDFPEDTVYDCWQKFKAICEEGRLGCFYPRIHAYYQDTSATPEQLAADVLKVYTQRREEAMTL